VFSLNPLKGIATIQKRNYHKKRKYQN